MNSSVNFNSSRPSLSSLKNSLSFSNLSLQLPIIFSTFANPDSVNSQTPYSVLPGPRKCQLTHDGLLGPGFNSPSMTKSLRRHEILFSPTMQLASDHSISCSFHAMRFLFLMKLNTCFLVGLEFS